MGIRGPKPRGKVKIEWSADFAYAIGLIVTDGNLAQYKSRITLVSKDVEQIENFMKCLNLKNTIGLHDSGSGNLARRVQFCDVLFYKFLNSIGIFPTKSKTIGEIKIPDEYFFDYLRGCFDGDGCIYSYWDKRWASSFMYYVCFCSASKKHITWLQNTIISFLDIKGHVTKTSTDSFFQLRFAKADSLKLISKMYENEDCTHLSRKRLKICNILDIVGKSFSDLRY